MALFTGAARGCHTYRRCVAHHVGLIFKITQCFRCRLTKTLWSLFQLYCAISFMKEFLENGQTHFKVKLSKTVAAAPLTPKVLWATKVLQVGNKR